MIYANDAPNLQNQQAYIRCAVRIWTRPELGVKKRWTLDIKNVKFQWARIGLKSNTKINSVRQV
ncbi:hypothetical protein PGB90_003801 [Kerria lacca]